MSSFCFVRSVCETFAILLLILLALPASWFGTIAENPQDFSNSKENEAFLAHADFSTETSIGLDGIVLEFEASGYDIGMVRPANRSVVEAEPPTPGTPDADSYICFQVKCVRIRHHMSLKWSTIGSFCGFSYRSLC